MPKMKTNRFAAKKFRVTASGRVKRARANTGHNTGKKSRKLTRQLKGRVVLDKTNSYALKKLLPNAGIK
ncbi:MAG TPA: 50S ribosomal protein L35 [Oligoflexia bacterium]|nr:50S ribosomal protein L35 [Oligoflexia bacterium]HMP26640.1 50S ribosomal protein L35 [Oligoflexia bacterium]